VIVRDLDLKKPIYQRTAAYGHFGPMSFLNSWCSYRETSFLQRAVLLAGRRKSLHT
uniref:Methionine adenosyltransferase 2A n=6 Tax=Boreoeutheria TaxID=1437010 RepID=A0A287D091_ICTTR